MRDIHGLAKKIQGNYTAIYIYEVDGNPTPCDQFRYAVVHRINTFKFSSYTKFGKHGLYTLKANNKLIRINK